MRQEYVVAVAVAGAAAAGGGRREAGGGPGAGEGAEAAGVVAVLSSSGSHTYPTPAKLLRPQAQLPHYVRFECLQFQGSACAVGPRVAREVGS